LVSGVSLFILALLRYIRDSVARAAALDRA
jgi:hypothetical protein